MKKEIKVGDCLQYKGYSGTVEFSEEDNCLFGQVIGIRSCLLYEGNSLDELTADFKGAVYDYLYSCELHGDTPEKPFKGSFNVRIGSELHQLVDQKAREQNTSINSIVKEAVSAYCSK